MKHKDLSRVFTRSRPRVSIVTISYNQVRFLERAIRSVLEQDYPEIEYIVVDPGSEDGSLDVIERHRDRIATLIGGRDSGPADGLNKGFAAASGEIFAYVNADDALLAGAVGRAVEAFERMPEADVVSGHGYIVDGSGRVLRRFRSAPFGPRRFAYGASVVMQQSTFIRRCAFFATGGFNISNGTSWDGELLLDMSLAGARFRVVNEYWSIFTVHEDSLGGSNRRADESAAMHRRYFETVMGRGRRPGDALLGGVLRAHRWACDPSGALQRLCDTVLGPPRVARSSW